MRFFLTFSLIFTMLIASAQVDSVSLKKTMTDFDRALVAKDDQTLGKFLRPEVSYGHSNGWVQNYTDIISDMKSGKLAYNKIENVSMTIAAITDGWATVRTNTNIEARMNGNDIQLKLHILEVWLKSSSGWQLLARQSTKLQ